MIDRIRSFYGEMERQRQEERRRQQLLHREEMSHDPVESLVLDPVSQTILLLIKDFTI